MANIKKPHKIKHGPHKKKQHKIKQVSLSKNVIVKLDEDGKYYLRNTRINMIIGSQNGYQTIESAKKDYNAFCEKLRKNRPHVIIYRARSCS